MSYYFAIVGTKDNPLFELEFGTSKQGGDGISRFREEQRHMNQFIVHASLDMVEELQWNTGAMYLKSVDRYYNSHISCWLTAGNIKFLLLLNPDPLASTASHPGSLSAITSSTTSISSSGATSTRSSRPTSVIVTQPTNPATEEAQRLFFAEVYENWVKCLMNPFYEVDMPVRSQVFRARVVAAAKKYLTPLHGAAALSAGVPSRKSPTKTAALLAAVGFKASPKEQTVSSATEAQ